MACEKTDNEGAMEDFELEEGGGRGEGLRSGRGFCLPLCWTLVLTSFAPRVFQAASVIMWRPETSLPLPIFLRAEIACTLIKLVAGIDIARGMVNTM